MANEWKDEGLREGKDRAARRAASGQMRMPYTALNPCGGCEIPSSECDKCAVGKLRARLREEHGEPCFDGSGCEYRSIPCNRCPVLA